MLAVPDVISYVYSAILEGLVTVNVVSVQTSSTIILKEPVVVV
jgi:hypothetical protein